MFNVIQVLKLTLPMQNLHTIKGKGFNLYSLIDSFLEEFTEEERKWQPALSVPPALGSQGLRSLVGCCRGNSHRVRHD